MHIRGNSFTNIQVTLYCTKIIILFNIIIYINITICMSIMFYFSHTSTIINLVSLFTSHVWKKAVQENIKK
jgi:hypothetical protein